MNKKENFSFTCTRIIYLFIEIFIIYNMLFFQFKYTFINLISLKKIIILVKKIK